MNPFDDGVMDCSGRGYDLACMNETVIDHGFAYMLDAGDWWIFCRVFLLEETPIRQTMGGFLGWVTRVVSDLMTWIVGVKASGVEGGIPPRVIDFALVLMRFLMICGGGGVCPYHVVAKHFPAEEYPWSGVYVGRRLSERLRRMCLSFMTCARNYLRLMWMDGEWVGMPLVTRLGYSVEVWPLARGSFREVWGRVVGGGDGHLPRSPLDFLMHSVVGGGVCDHQDLPGSGPSSGSGGIPFERLVREHGIDGVEGCLDAFLTFSAFCCVNYLFSSTRGDEFGGLRGVYLGADIHRRRHVEGWWEKLLVGRGDVLGSCGYVRRFFSVFGIEFGAGGICGSWTSEWRFEVVNGAVWGSLGGKVGRVPQEVVGGGSGKCF